MARAVQLRAVEPMAGATRAVDGFGSLRQPTQVSSALGTGGQRLPAPLSARLSGAFGSDLSGVEVHPDSHVPARMGAHALTVGNRVAFAPGMYRPNSADGERLIAHEMAHVVQQRGGMGTTVQASGLGYDGFEAEADRAAARAIAGQQVGALSAAPTGMVQRDAPAAKPVTDDMSASRPVLPQTAGDAPLSTRVAAFEQLILDTAVLRLTRNREVLLQWHSMISQLPFDAAQLKAFDLADMLARADREVGPTSLAFENYLNSRAGSNTAAHYKSQVYGHNRACGGCHGLLLAERLDRDQELGFPGTRGPTVYEKLTHTEPKSTLPPFVSSSLLSGELSDGNQAALASFVRSLDAKTPAAAGQSHASPSHASPSHAPVATPAPINRADTELIRKRVSDYAPIFQVLGPSGYKVLDTDQYTWSQGTGEQVRSGILADIQQRRADYLELIDEIKAGDRDYYEFLPIIQQLLPLAAPDVGAAVKETLEDKEFWDKVRAVVTLGAALVVAVVSFFFPPAGAVGALLLGAAELGLGAEMIYQGVKAYDLGHAYSLGTGADDVYSRGQQEAGLSLMVSGVLSAVGGFLGSFGALTRIGGASAVIAIDRAGTAVGIGKVSGGGSIHIMLGKDGAWMATAQGAEGSLMIAGQGPRAVVMLQTAKGLTVVHVGEVPFGSGTAASAATASAPSTSTALAPYGSPLSLSPELWMPAQTSGALVPVMQVGGATSLITPTRWNPSGLTTNCGFCVISHALEYQQPGAFRTADELYLEQLARLGLPTGGADPIPRQLIFPEPNLDLYPVRVGYEALAEGSRSASDYTITRVALDSGLQITPKTDVLTMWGRVYGAHASLDDAVAAHIEAMEIAGRTNLPPASRLKASFSRARVELQGEYLVGSKTSTHYVRATIHPDGSITGFDPQNNAVLPNLAAIRASIGSIDYMALIKAPPILVIP